jgi:nitrite reductase (NO-forming)
MSLPAAPGGFFEQSPGSVLSRFMPFALAMLAAAAIAFLASFATATEELRWLALHLAFLGGVSQLIVGVGQFFVCAYLATVPPKPALLKLQLAVWNVGALMVGTGGAAGVDPLAEAGALVIVSGVALFAAGLEYMRRRSLRKAWWALLWYYAAAASLAVGALLGALLVSGVIWTHGSLLAAHITFNVGGWIGTAIVGTLHTFYPTLTGTQLAHPRLQAPTFWLWVGGVWLLGAALACSFAPLALAAIAAIAAASLLLAVNLLAALRKRTMPLTLAAKTVTAGQLLLPLATVLALLFADYNSARGATLDGAMRNVVLACLFGWIALTVAGSLDHLLRVMLRVRRIRSAGFPR